MGSDCSALECFMKKYYRLLLLVLGVTVSVGRAETLFEVDFSSLKEEALGAGQTMSDRNGTANFWQGPKEGEFGRFAVTGLPKEVEDKSESPALAIYDNSPQADKAPVFSVELSKLPDDVQTIILEMTCLVPLEGSYLGLIGIGRGSWESAAAMLTVTNEKISAWQQGDTYENAGNYRANKWTDLRVVMDLGKKTFDVYVNGEKTGSDIPWSNAVETPPSYFEVCTDLQAIDRMGDPVFFIRSLKISAEHAR